jgi:hypothetical protein
MIKQQKKYILKDFYEKFLSVGKSIWENFQKENTKEYGYYLWLFSSNRGRLPYVHMKI